MWHPGIRDGRKWRKGVKIGGNDAPTGAKNFALKCFFGGNFVCTTISEEIILDDISLGGSPTIFATLNDDKYVPTIATNTLNTLIKFTAFKICKL